MAVLVRQRKTVMNSKVATRNIGGGVHIMPHGGGIKDETHKNMSISVLPTNRNIILHSNSNIADFPYNALPMPDKGDDSILICIFNYRKDENARKWHNLLSPYFETYVLDSGNDKVCEDFIQFPNIYYSGLFNETKKLSEKKNYEWIGVIPSDVTIQPEYEDKLIKKIHWLKGTENIGQWQPSLDSTSRNWCGNIHTDRYKYEGKRIIEGHFYFVKNNLLKAYPYIDTSINKYGWGIAEAISALSLRIGLENIFDNTLQIHHPSDCGYSPAEAKEEMDIYARLMCHALNIDYGQTYRYDNLSMGEQRIQYKQRKVYALMTSWKQRINIAHMAINSLLNNSFKPKVILTLSEDEFLEKEKELPETILDLVNSKQIILYWVKENTKTIKKIYPAINLLNDDDIIINADDDIVFPYSFIQDRLDDFYATDGVLAITSNPDTCRPGIQTLGPGSLFTKRMLKGWETFIDDKVLKTYEDDHINAYLIYLNGYKVKRCANNSIRTYKNFSQDNAAGKMGLYNSSITNPILDNRVLELYGKSFNEIIKA